VGGVIDRLRRLGIGASVEFFFLLLDEGAIARPILLVPAMDAAIRDFLPSASVVSAAAVGVASVAPLSSIVLRPGVARFVDGDRIHGLRGLRLLDLMWPRSVAITRPLLVHFFESLPLAFVRDAIFLQYLEEPVDGLWFAALKVLYAQAKA
jgi:hypothetical protein